MGREVPEAEYIGSGRVFVDRVMPPANFELSPSILEIQQKQMENISGIKQRALARRMMRQQVEPPASHNKTDQLDFPSE